MGDRGLAFDLGTLLQRRRALLVIGGAGLAALAGYGWGTRGSGDPTGSASRTQLPTGSGVSNRTSNTDGSIPEETAGPYPGDGTNGPNVLTESGIVRRDIRSSFGSARGVAEGVALTVTLTLTDNVTSEPLEGAALYLWHCDREGRYSMYSEGVTDQNYLRGVQQADGSGTVTFTSIFPGCYAGRWPHIHFEVYATIDDATAAGSPLRTSQLAFPQDVCDSVYATAGYQASVDNMSRVSLDSDMVFSDGYSAQLATVTGDPDSGLVAALAVPL